MTRCAILCGSAPEDFRQQKLLAMHDFLTGKKGGAWAEREITLFPNGVHELLLESVLNNAFDVAAEDGGEVLLYFCALSERDLRAELSDCACTGVDVVRLGDDEIRKDVIAYYAEKLAGFLDVNCRVVYEVDDALVSEEILGWEKLDRESVKC